METSSAAAFAREKITKLYTQITITEYKDLLHKNLHWANE